jgi:hypothetical protein
MTPVTAIKNSAPAHTLRDLLRAAPSLNGRAWAALVLLGAFETEMSFILADEQEVIRARSERAFPNGGLAQKFDEQLVDGIRFLFND